MSDNGATPSLDKVRSLLRHQIRSMLLQPELWGSEEAVETQLVTLFRLWTLCTYPLEEARIMRMYWSTLRDEGYSDVLPLASQTPNNGQTKYEAIVGLFLKINAALVEPVMEIR